MGGLGPQARHDLGGGVGGGLQFGRRASGLGVTGAGTGGVSNGRAGRSSRLCTIRRLRRSEDDETEIGGGR